MAEHGDCVSPIPRSHPTHWKPAAASSKPCHCLVRSRFWWSTAMCGPIIPSSALPAAPVGLAHLVLVDNPSHHLAGDFALCDDGQVGKPARRG